MNPPAGTDMRQHEEDGRGLNEADRPSTVRVESPRLPVKDPAWRSRVLWELLDAVDRHIESSPSSVWDRAVMELADQVSVGLAGRLREIAAEQVIDRSAPGAYPYRPSVEPQR